MKKLKKVSLQLFELQAEKILEIPDRQSTEKEAWELLKEKKKHKLSFIYREHALSLFDRFSQQLYGETLAKGPIRIICNGM